MLEARAIESTRFITFQGKLFSMPKKGIGEEKSHSRHLVPQQVDLLSQVQDDFGFHRSGRFCPKVLGWSQWSQRCPPYLYQTNEVNIERTSTQRSPDSCLRTVDNWFIWTPSASECTAALEIALSFRRGVSSSIGSSLVFSPLRSSPS